MNYIKKISEEHKIWTSKNFPDAELIDYILGIIEEVGELSHHVLKRKQNIRNNENHEEEIKDAVADICIFIIGYCNKSFIDVNDVFEDAICKMYTDFNYKFLNRENELYALEISIITGQISKNIFEKFYFKRFNRSSIIDEFKNLILTLTKFCVLNRFSFDENLINVWNKVKQRDWKANSNNGLVNNSNQLNLFGD